MYFISCIIIQLTFQPYIIIVSIRNNILFAFFLTEPTDVFKCEFSSEIIPRKSLSDFHTSFLLAFHFPFSVDIMPNDNLTLWLGYELAITREARTLLYFCTRHSDNCDLHPHDVGVKTNKNL